MRLGWPLTGRSKEMRLIEAALSDRDCSGIVVCGAAGVGKSRIAREAMTSAASNGCEVRWVVATNSARALPLGALRSWVGPAGGDSLQLVRGVIESLTCAPHGATVVVGVDDAPLLDDLSIFVVHQIVQGGGAKVVFTVRDGEPVPAAIQEVLKAGQFDRLDLEPLSRGETDALLSSTLGGSLDPGAAVQLWELTRGNVLYLRNIVEHEVADGRLVRQHGVWRWLGDPVVPPGLAELIESRIGALPTSFIVDRESRVVQKHVGMLTARTTESETRHLAGLPVNASIEEFDQTQGLQIVNGAQATTIPGAAAIPRYPQPIAPVANPSRSAIDVSFRRANSPAPTSIPTPHDPSRMPKPSVPASRVRVA